MSQFSCRSLIRAPYEASRSNVAKRQLTSAEYACETGEHSIQGRSSVAVARTRFPLGRVGRTQNPVSLHRYRETIQNRLGEDQSGSPQIEWPNLQGRCTSAPRS